jgi:hypothetical protein
MITKVPPEFHAPTHDKRSDSACCIETHCNLAYFVTGRRNLDNITHVTAWTRRGPALIFNFLDSCLRCLAPRGPLGMIVPRWIKRRAGMNTCNESRTILSAPRACENPAYNTVTRTGMVPTPRKVSEHSIMESPFKAADERTLLRCLRHVPHGHIIKDVRS